MKLTKRQLRKIIQVEKAILIKEVRGNPEQDGVMEAEAAVSRAARELRHMGYNFQDICDVVDEALQDPEGRFPSLPEDEY